MTIVKCQTVAVASTPIQVQAMLPTIRAIRNRMPAHSHLFSSGSSGYPGQVTRTLGRGFERRHDVNLAKCLIKKANSSPPKPFFVEQCGAFEGFEFFERCPAFGPHRCHEDRLRQTFCEVYIMAPDISMKSSTLSQISLISVI
jgi:hypothetical protein